MKKHELVHYSLSDFAKFFSSFSSVIEVNESYEGCVNGSNISNPQTVTMKAHEASPSKCIEICRERKSQWAYVRERSCKCSNSSQTSSKLIEKCNKRCWSNSSLVCGGDGDDAFSAYKTGKSVIYHHMFSMFPAGRMQLRDFIIPLDVILIESLLSYFYIISVTEAPWQSRYNQSSVVTCIMARYWQ